MRHQLLIVVAILVICLSEKFKNNSEAKMSVLNQSGEEQVECPLCMEALEVDDLNFFPCTCGYQICRFCWHRIRTDENGLCPACRKAYGEDPADFIPLSKEQVAKLKADKRHRDQQRKAKLSENRKHLASVRVVQRNLVFVVGLPVRLADPELLKKHEYFGKFGKIHKVVINQSTSYAGSQGPSASAYVTYMKSDDALRAIQSVNNIMIDGRVLKSSLGTTKYCSHFMKNQPCPKADCMYLHDFGDPEASFTKEQMHAGKHQEYEKKLHEGLLSRQSSTTPPSNMGQCEKGGSSCSSSPPSSQQHEVYSKKDTSGSSASSSVGSSKGKESTPPSSGNSNKDNWPQLSLEKGEKATEVKKSDQSKDKSKSNKAKSKNCPGSPTSVQAITMESTSASPSGLYSDNTVKLESKRQDRENCDTEIHNRKEMVSKLELEQISNIGELHNKQIQRDNLEKFKNGMEGQSIFGLGDSKLGLSSDNSSFFSQGFQTVNHILNGLPPSPEEDHHPDHSNRDNELTTPPGVMSDTFPSLNTSEDWVFGFENDHLEELAKQATRIRQAGVPPKESIDTLVNGINTSGNILGNIHQNVPSQNGPGTHLAGYGASKFFDDYETSRRYLESSKLHEPSLIDNLVVNNSSKTNGYVNTQHFGGLTNKEVLTNGTNGLNGLDHNTSKFFMDFHKNQTQLNMLNGIHSLMTPQTQQQQQNGYYQQQTAVQEHLLLLQQKQLEEQLRNINLKQQQNYQFQNGYYNRDINSSSPSPFGGRHLYNMPVQGQTQGGGMPQAQPAPSMVVGQGQPKVRHPEDELDFDPFQETQKGLAELIATEKSQTQGRTNMTQGIHMNGLMHGQSNSGMAHIPPPPPGFVQQQQNSTHMNSFGSKILPYLNMSNNPQSLSSSTQNSWPNGYVNQQKNISTNVNDWKNLDPAILSSSRHFPLANISAPSIREHSTFPSLAQQPLNGLANLNPQTSPTQNVRPHSYMNGSTDFSTTNIFSNFAQQLQQPNLNGFTTHTNQINNWFTSEAFSNTNITSPPGFRNSQSKQQEC